MTRLGKDARLVQDERGIYSIEPTEAAFLQQVIGLAGMLGWKWFHDYATNHRQKCPKCGHLFTGSRNPPGFPDLLLVRERLVFPELKVGKNTLTAAQVGWRDALQAAGQETHEWRPADWAAIVSALR